MVSTLSQASKTWRSFPFKEESLNRNEEEKSVNVQPWVALGDSDEFVTGLSVVDKPKENHMHTVGGFTYTSDHLPSFLQDIVTEDGNCRYLYHLKSRSGKQLYGTHRLPCASKNSHQQKPYNFDCVTAIMFYGITS
ncbi:hypothetical protein NPIL_159991 [Nephila pilipes]|uniref:Uncharacterized protein n=1 Tax=Nephila pilipes TaxID=299642 RepID=A0A8X6NN64_NEPPI|nr:hypothetical protein NPIL_159991 [Nephila pilipes]